MSSVIITLCLPNGSFSDSGLSDGMVIKSEQVDEILPRGLAVGIDGDLGKGTY